MRTTDAFGNHADVAALRLDLGLLASIAHDVRSPLTTICGIAHALGDALPTLTPEQGDMLEQLQAEAVRTGALLNSLLDLLRVAHSGATLKQEWQSMEEVVGGAVRICAKRLEAHQLTIDIADDFPLLRVDAVLLERVLVNLLDNAAKYTPAGSRVAIVASFNARDAHILVQDDGPGLPHGWGDQGFQAFHRGPSASAIPGTGLGHVICRSMMTAMGGRFFICRSAFGGAGLALVLPVERQPVCRLEELAAPSMGFP
jgi:two-component system sensor histidine kinase KdpD